MSIATDLADALTAELNASALLPVPAVRRILPEFDLQDLTELKVSVVPRGITYSGSTRSVTQVEVAVDVGFQQRIGIDLDQADTLGSLVDSVVDYLRQRTLAGMPAAVWVATANDPILAADHLTEQRVFTSVLSITYRMLR